MRIAFPLSAIALSLAASVAFATDDVADERATEIGDVPATGGVHGFVLFGAGLMDIESNTIAGGGQVDMGDERLNSVFDDPNSDSVGHPAFTGEIAYTFGESRTEVFLGSSLENLLTFDVSQALGVRTQIESAGIFSIAGLFSGIPGQVWEDPYQDGSDLDGPDRERTDRESAGVRVEWSKIMDTGLVFRASQREIDVDKEFSGDYLAGQGRLTSAETRLLRRDGTDTAMSLSYNIPVAEGQVLRPEVGLLNADRDGDAQSRDTYRAQLAWAVKGDPISWTFTGEVGSSEYDKANPIYREAQDSEYYALGAAGFYKLPWQGWSAMLSVRYAKEDSDVDFHDQQLSSVILGAQYFFGGR